MTATAEILSFLSRRCGRYIPRNINSVDFRNSRSWYACKDKPDFLAQFKSANTDKFVLVKDGSGAAAGDEKIDAISGSTVTSKAVLRGVNSALIAYKEIYAAKAVTVGGVSVE